MTSIAEGLELEDFVKECIEGSPILRKGDIAGLIEKGDTGSLWLYCRRIAAYTAAQMRSSGRCPPTDDTDYIDAVQECMLHVPTLLKTWEDSGAQFSTYASQAFRIIVWRYLWTLAKGGTGTVDSYAPLPTELPAHLAEGEAMEETDNVRTADYVIDDIPVPIGMRDPLLEVETLENMKLALLSLHVPMGTNRLNGYRQRRVRTELGIDI